MFYDLHSYALIINYYLIDRWPWLAAWKIAHHLDPRARMREVIPIARQLAKKNVKALSDSLQKEGESIRDLGFSFYDSKTFFHRRHVSSLVSMPARKRIGDEAVSRIREVFKGQIDERGDLLPSSR